MSREKKSRRPPKPDLDVDPRAHFQVLPKRVALAAVDLYAATKKTTSRTDYKYGFDPFLGEIAKVANANGCDTIVYSLWSHDEAQMRPLNERRLFGATSKVKTIFLEATDLNGKSRIEVWQKGCPAPHCFEQCFSRSRARVADKQAFMDGLPARKFGSTLFLACGEANIISTQRNSSSLTDPFGFMTWLADANPEVIINPSHDYMQRPEMKTKRALYSRGGRTVLSVWNRGHKRSEAADPWQAYVDGKEVSKEIREVSFPKTVEIRLGVFDIPAPAARTRRSRTHK
jgi:hypothetical protein